MGLIPIRYRNKLLRHLNPLCLHRYPNPLPIPLQFRVTTRSARCNSTYQAIKVRRGGVGDGRVRPPLGGGFRGRGLPLPPNAVRHIYRNSPK